MYVLAGCRIRHPRADELAALAHGQRGGLPSRLSTFAEEVGAGPNKHILLVLDRAGWHRSARLKLPEGIHLVFLPPYSPEVQPAERLWPLSNEPLANRVFTC